MIVQKVHINLQTNVGVYTGLAKKKIAPLDKGS